MKPRHYKGCCFACGIYDTFDRVWYYPSHRTYRHIDPKDCESYRYQFKGE